MRTFLALDLPSEIKSALADLLRKLKRVAPPAIGWARDSGLHLTLKFLGEIEESRLSEIVPRMKSVAERTPAFPLIVRGTGVFPPPPRPPRILWIGFDETPSLLDFHRRLEVELEVVGFPREVRPFQPHLTLGRIKAPGGLGAVLDIWMKNEKINWGDMIVREVVLFQSILRPSGAEYIPLQKGLLLP